jgi:energy-coupling factor transporter ATP-binding protein EcfA2
MIIDQLEIEGFKSYKEKTILKNFGDHFNAITGNNGCGKSNILDSICFVLGISNLNIIRASRIEDLIYQDENLKLNSAKVTLMLKDSEIQKFGDKVLRNKKSISISRTIFISGKNRYSLGGIRVAPGKILNFLYSVNLNITYPHFIIHQGHISKVSLMTQTELLDLVENSIGTKLFESKKKLAVETIRNKKERLKSIHEIMNDNIRPIIENSKRVLIDLKKKNYNKYIEDKFILFHRFFKNLKNFKEISEIKNRKINFSKFNSKKSLEIISFSRSKFNSKGKNDRKKNFNLINLIKNIVIKFKNIKKSVKIFNLLQKLKKIRKRIFFVFSNENLKIERFFFQKYLFYRTKNFKNFHFLSIKKCLGVGNVYDYSFYQNDILINLITSLKIDSIKYTFSKSSILNKINQKFFDPQIENFILIRRSQCNIFSGKNKILKKLLNSDFIKKFFFLFESQFTFFFCFEKIFDQNTKKNWNNRQYLLGSLFNIVQPKIPDLICVYEFSFSNKISSFIAKCEINMGENLHKFQDENKKNLVLIDKTKKCSFLEIFFLKTFRISAFFGFPNRSYSIINSVSKFFLLNGRNKIKNNIDFKKQSIELITLFGEILKPFDNTFYLGSFQVKFNRLFHQIQLNKFCLEWIRNLLVSKKNEKVKRCFKIVVKSLKNSFLDNKNNSVFLYRQKFLKKLKQIFYINKKTRLNTKRITFLKRIIKFSLKNLYKYRKPIQNIETEKLDNPGREFIRKIVFHKVLLLRTIMKICLPILLFFRDFLEFFVSTENYKKFKQNYFFVSNIQYEYKVKNGIFFKNLTKQKPSFPKILKNVKLHENQVLNKWNSFNKQIKNYFIAFYENNNSLFTKTNKIKKNFNVNFFEKISFKYDIFLFKRLKIEKDRIYIEEIIAQLERERENTICVAIKKINSSFRIIFKSILPFYDVKIKLRKNIFGTIIGIHFSIFSLKIYKNLNELSGGQRSILSLSFIFSLLIFRASPFYILDEIDAALDFCYTKNISQMISITFSFAQFIIISLKKQIISDAEVVFEIGNNGYKSVVTRFIKRNKK